MSASERRFSGWYKSLGGYGDTSIGAESVQAAANASEKAIEEAKRRSGTNNVVEPDAAPVSKDSEQARDTQ